MRRFPWLILLLTVFPATLHPQEAAPLSGERLRKDLEEIGSFGPRLEGSPGERRLVAWIGARLASMGIRGSSFDFSQSDFQHSFSSCIRVELKGELPDTLILAVPLDSFPGATSGNDGAVNVALALDLLGRLRKTVPRVSLTVLFLGAEFGDADPYPMGSTLFLRDFQPEYRVAVLYLNLREVPSRLLVRGGGRGLVSPYWLMNRCVDALRAAKIPFLLRGDENQVFRLGLTSERTVIEPWLKAGYPAVGLEGEYVPEEARKAEDWAYSFSAFFSGLLDASAGGIPEEWDRHYLLFQAGDLSLIVTEKAYVVVLLAALAGMLLYSLLFQRGTRKYARTLARNFLAVIPLAGSSFAFLLAGTVALDEILSLRRFTDLWTYAPFEFLALKACIALFLYGALYNLARRLPFPRAGSFYSAAALFFLLLDIVVVAVFNLSFTFYFLWAFLFVFLSAITRKRVPKLLLFLPAPFWCVRGLVEVFLMPALPFCRFLLFSRIWGNLLIAGVALPFVLYLLRLGRLFPGRGILKRKVREVLLGGAALAAGCALAARIVFSSPFSPANPQPILATQSIDAEAAASSLSLTSPAPLGTLLIGDGAGERELTAGDTAITVPLAQAPVPLSVAVESREFLGKRTVSLLMEMPSSPRGFAATLSSGDDFILFDSSFPFVRESAREYRLLIGAFPPNPLPLQLTFPAGGTFTLTLTIDFDSPLIGVRVTPRGEALVTTKVHLVKTLSLKT